MKVIFLNMGISLVCPTAPQAMWQDYGRTSFWYFCTSPYAEQL
ncbi:MAG TPA: hypothetical protein VFC92_11400 [Bacteroidales bacterium]|nr:hypothetical protein [Bacteroidales bacterium]